MGGPFVGGAHSRKRPFHAGVVELRTYGVASSSRTTPEVPSTSSSLTYLQKCYQRGVAEEPPVGGSGKAVGHVRRRRVGLGRIGSDGSGSSESFFRPVPSFVFWGMPAALSRERVITCEPLFRLPRAYAL